MFFFFFLCSAIDSWLGDRVTWLDRDSIRCSWAFGGAIIFGFTCRQVKEEENEQLAFGNENIGNPKGPMIGA